MDSIHSKKNPHVESYLTNYDIVTLIETWTQRYLDINNVLTEDHYLCVHDKRKHKQRHTSGGIMTVIKKDILNNAELLPKCEYERMFIQQT